MSGRRSPRTNVCESCCATNWELAPVRLSKPSTCACSVSSPRFRQDRHKVATTLPQQCGRMLIFMTTTSRAVISRLSADDLAEVRGAIITADDPRYEAARAVYNGTVD